MGGGGWTAGGAKWAGGVGRKSQLANFTRGPDATLNVQKYIKTFGFHTFVLLTSIQKVYFHSLPSWLCQEAACEFVCGYSLPSIENCHN